MTTRKICFFDTETTGLSPDKERLVEIGVIIHEYDKFNNVSKESIERATLLNPERPIPPVVSRIHGLFDKDVAQAPLFKDVVKSIKKAIPERSIIVAHNAPFDLRFLLAEAHKVGEGDWVKSLLAINTLTASRSLRKGKRHSLDALCTAMNVAIPEKGRHRAIVDCRMLRDSFVTWTEKLGTLMLPNILQPSPAINMIGIPFIEKIEGKAQGASKVYKPRPPLPISNADEIAHKKMMERINKESNDGAVWTLELEP